MFLNIESTPTSQFYPKIPKMQFLKSLNDAGFRLSIFERMTQNGLFGVDSIFIKLLNDDILDGFCLPEVRM
jgi:hypothetical protein